MPVVDDKMKLRSRNFCKPISQANLWRHIMGIKNLDYPKEINEQPPRGLTDMIEIKFFHIFLQTSMVLLICADILGWGNNRPI